MTTSIFIMHQSSSTRKQKRRKYSTNKSTLFKNYYDKTTFKVKDENGKVVADKKHQI
jgi:hypothetical protein